MGHYELPCCVKLGEGHTMGFYAQKSYEQLPLMILLIQGGTWIILHIIAEIYSTPPPSKSDADLIRYQNYPKLMVFDSKTYLLSNMAFSGIHVSFRGCIRIFQPIFFVFFPKLSRRLSADPYRIAPHHNHLKDTERQHDGVFFAEENDV